MAQVPPHTGGNCGAAVARPCCDADRIVAAQAVDLVIPAQAAHAVGDAGADQLRAGQGRVVRVGLAVVVAFGAVDVEAEVEHGVVVERGAIGELQLVKQGVGARVHLVEALQVQHVAIAEVERERAQKARIRDGNLSGEAKRTMRLTEAKPVVDRFFAWVNKLFEGQGFLPSSPLTTALAYARERREGLEVYLNDPDVQIDTNHLERALRAIPMGRKNWMFSWTELGATHVGIVQSLLVTCRLHDIDPYDYFVDVLQRVAQHPASKVEQLTPRRWKDLFADKLLRSDLYDLNGRRNHAAG